MVVVRLTELVIDYNITLFTTMADFTSSFIQDVVVTRVLKWRDLEFANIQEEKTQDAYGRWRNQPCSFGDLGSVGEHLCLDMYPDSVGSASKGGCAFDNLTYSDGNLESAKEVKFVSLDGTKECSSCHCKAPSFQPICIHCMGGDFKLKHDSRAGISASAHIKYKKTIKEYIIFVSKYNEETESIKLFAFKIMTDNDYFNTYINKQHDDGTGNTCNLQPFSRDFHMSGPIKLFEVDLFKGAHTIIHFNLSNTEIEPIPYKNWNTNNNILRSKELKQLKIDHDLDEGDFGETGLNYVEHISKFSVSKKTHGKSRGSTSRAGI